ncbi:diguanylate phosphodiesterase [Spirochaetia bacterium]|nr:diguanylate phosphodiesterase [Spirochaetia bacterium]
MKKHRFTRTGLTLALGLIQTLVISVPVYAGGGKDTRMVSSGNGQPIEGGELRVGITTEPATLDPLSASNTADGRSILFNVFEGLVKPDATGGLRPAAAESYAIEQNGLVYVFKLRQGLKFHDGTAVTPEDVLFTLNTAIGGNLGGFSQIDKVEIAADKSIRITLKAADVEFLPYLTVGIVPRNNADREKKAIGTGPFSIESYTTQQTLVLKKNPDYWQKGLPHLDKVIYVFLENSDARFLALQAGTVDSSFVFASEKAQLNPNKYEFFANYSNSIQLLALNNAAGPLKDLRVRQALNYAVDRQGIIDAAFFGLGEPWGSPLIPGLSKYTDPTLKNPYPVDIPKAKTLLAAAGYPDGFPLEITVPSVYVMHVDTAQVIISQLAKVGVTARIKLVDWPTWQSETFMGRRYEATVISVDSSNISPRSFLARYQSEAMDNFVNFKSPAYDKVYSALLVETDEAKRIDLYKQAQRIISEEAASVYIQDIQSYGVYPAGVGGVFSYPQYVTDYAPVYRTR